MRWRKKWRSQKESFSSSTNSQYFFVKLPWIGPLVNGINWCEGQWCCSTYMVVRLSNVSSFPLHQFILFTQELIHEISVKNIENWRSWKMRFFLGGHFEFSKSAILIFFSFISMKKLCFSYKVSFISWLRMVSSQSWKRLHPN